VKRINRVGMDAGHDGQRDFFRRLGADIQADRPKYPIAYTRSVTAQALQQSILAMRGA
jgi:hypothetical protein